MKFYRLILIISGALVACAAIAHLTARKPWLAAADAAVILLTVALYLIFGMPKRIVYKLTNILVGVAYVIGPVILYHLTIRPQNIGWSIAGALSSTAILGSVNLAMLLGHWYLVVRGMPIEPLKRLTIATLASSIVRVLVVVAAALSLAPAGFEYGTPLHRLFIAQGLFFWMRVGWGLIGPLGLYPMIWGTVKIRSTMAATGILYVGVVAVVIGEVLSVYLSHLQRLPV